MVRNKLLQLIGITSAAFMLLATTSASAAIVELDFEGAGDFSRLLNFYNQGFDSAGNQGVDYGIAFGTGAFTAVAAADGSSGFTNLPSGNTLLYFDGSASWLNVAMGFSQAFSFMYSSAQAAEIVIYDGLAGTGNILASLSIESQFDRNCAGDSYFCTWDLAAVSFDGLARSVSFAQATDWSIFDNLRFGTSANTPTQPIPAPASLILLASGLLLTRYSKKK